MNIPGSVRIGSMDYKIKVSDEMILVNHTECYGSIDFRTKIIRINNEAQSIQGQEETLLHEIFHGICEERNFTYLGNDDETITEELARGLHQLIRDNTGMFVKS
ncbi:MAG TPA: hypothetical protein VIK26_01460 [Clostridium sp.]